ncbi:MAG: hypothetical protein ACT4NY_19790 [Pseudonocardiales bacterium]
MAGVWDNVGEFASGVVDGAGQVVGGIARGVGDVVGVFDIGESSGTDGGSSNWAAWGHAEIRSMLDTTVDPADIDEGARAWAQWNRLAADIITRWTSELREMVSAGWRGGSADAALGSLGPVDNWAYGLSENGEQTARLLDGSGYSAGQAKAAVPPAESHDWGRSLTSFGLGGPGFALVDAVAQDQAQAQAEAVRVMNSVYSAPINENRSAIQPAAQLTDPTLQPPEPSLNSGPRPGAYPLGPGGGGSAGLPYQPPSAAGLQNVTGSGSSGSVDSGPYGPAQPTGPRQPVGGQGGGGHGPGVAAAGAVPFIPPMAGGGIGSAAERAGRGFRGAGQVGGRPTGPGQVGGRSGGPGGGADFGPRGSGGVTAGPGTAGVGEARAGGVGTGGAGAPGRGGGGLGGVPVGGVGAGRGKGDEDTEHRRPSWLIEMNDIFSDGRKVAPPVIGEDPSEHHR